MNLTIATHLGELVVADMQQNHADNETRRATESAQMLEKYYVMVGVAKLLSICQVATSAELPQLCYVMVGVLFGVSKHSNIRYLLRIQHTSSYVHQPSDDHQGRRRR